MDAAKIKNLDALAEITFKIEFELNRVKDWINTQLSDVELNRCKNCKNTFHQNENNFGQVDPNLITSDIYHESSQAFQGGSQILGYRGRSEANLCQNPSTSTSTCQIKSRQSDEETNESDDDDIEIINETRNDFIVPHLIVNDYIDNTTRPSNTLNSRNSFYETAEIDPLSTGQDHNTEEEPAVIRTNVKKKRTRFNPDILKRIKSEQILESAKNWAKRKKIPTNSLKSKSHICTICNKGFHQISVLKSHLEAHSMMNNDETMMKYVCRFCSKGFTTSNAMNSHISRNHRGERNDLKFKCDCGLSFNIMSALENHKIEAHVGLQCKFCKNVFYKRPAFYKHIQRIHLICSTMGCEKKFLSLAALKLHRRKNHSANRMPIPTN